MKPHPLLQQMQRLIAILVVHGDYEHHTCLVNLYAPKMAIIMRIMAMLANIVITLLTDKNLYPTIDIVPPMNPINSPAHGPINISATEPIATPPANVAF